MHTHTHKSTKHKGKLVSWNALKLRIYVHHEIPVKDMKISHWVGEYIWIHKNGKGLISRIFQKKADNPIKKKMDKRLKQALCKITGRHPNICVCNHNNNQEKVKSNYSEIPLPTNQKDWQHQVFVKM